MKKLFLFVTFLSAAAAVASAPLPDNMYFRAMKDEMNRSLKKLHVKNGPKPYYMAYQLEHVYSYCEGATLGEQLNFSQEPSQQLNGQVVLAAGSPKNDSMGFASGEFRYAPAQRYSMAQSYWGIRHALWQITEDSYLSASEMYEKKQAYKRQKNITDNLPDFIRAPQASFVEDIPPFPQLPREQIQALVKKISAAGKDVPYVEDFRLNFCVEQQDWYYLNSDGGFYQYSQPQTRVLVLASVRNKKGYKKALQQEMMLPTDFAKAETAVQALADEVLQDAGRFYEASPVEPYIGPVLFTPAAAADFFNTLLIRNVRNVKPLLADNDKTAGAFRNKAGMRVMSPVVDVYDKPLQRDYKGIPLAGFKPVDDEGVQAQDLTVVLGGKLQQLPFSRRPVSAHHASNGHARMGPRVLPREALSNVFVQAKQPLDQQELEAKLLDRCRELELDYCYILKEFPSGLSGTDATVQAAERIYTQDGHREPVFGLKLNEVSTRSLRDILAAGKDEALFSLADPEYRSYSLVTPSVLVDEIEILPSDEKATRKPFVPKP